MNKWKRMIHFFIRIIKHIWIKVGSFLFPSFKKGLLMAKNVFFFSYNKKIVQNKLDPLPKHTQTHTTSSNILTVNHYHVSLHHCKVGYTFIMGWLLKGIMQGLLHRIAAKHIGILVVALARFIIILWVSVCVCVCVHVCDIQ